MPRSRNRTVTTTFRTQPGVRDALAVAAGRENRSLSNLIEQLAIEHCRRQGIPIDGLDPPASPTRRAVSNGEST